jgi:hypothetical protein
MGLKTPINHIKHMTARNLDTGLNAPQAHYASIHPLLNERRPIWNIWPLNPLRAIVLPVDPILVRQVLKLALAPGIADRTIKGMLDQQEHQGIPSHLLHAFRPCVNDHPLGHRSGTRLHWLLGPLNVDDAHSTGFKPTQLSQVAEGGNVNAVLPGRFQNGCPISSRDLLPINGNVHHP